MERHNSGVVSGPFCWATFDHIRVRGSKAAKECPQVLVQNPLSLPRPCVAGRDDVVQNMNTLLRHQLPNGNVEAVILRPRALSAVVIISVGAISAQASAGQPLSTTQSTASQAPLSLAEMEAAGARMAFDVASVKADISEAPANSRFPLGPGDGYAPGGSFSATNHPLIVYLRFAFKLGQSDLLGIAGLGLQRSV